MSRLVVVSNRLPTLRRTGEVGDPEVPVGGLASAVLGALRRRSGGVWFGWNGRTVEPDAAARVTRQSTAGFDLIGFPMSREEIDEFYLGYCNSTLWPLFHGFQDRVTIRLKHEASYRAMQAKFASLLMPLLREGDLVWVHDYHLLLLARELRRLGWAGRIGMFLHIPFPSHDLWQILPDPRDTLEALMDFDLVGFHVPSFLENYLTCCRRELGAHVSGTTVVAAHRRQRADVHPVGIDPDEFLPRPAVAMPAGADDVGGPDERADARDAAVPDRFRSRGQPVLGRSLRGRRLILGVDRLDYTKGIPEKIQGFEMLAARHAEWRRKAVLVQIASPSRTELPDYAEQRARIESLTGRVNGELGEHDWMPVRYLYRAYPRSFLARLYREADVGLVTPLRDGMNLVAKEFVAAQDPASPGVLVLSRCAGAAYELREAIIVNPYVPSDVAEGMHAALLMPIEERRARHSALLARVMSRTAADWGHQFVEDLENALPGRISHTVRVLGQGGEPPLFTPPLLQRRGTARLS